jgi:hypothetical protein
MARSYLPSKVPEIVAIWRKDLNKVMYGSGISYLLMMEVPGFCVSMILWESILFRVF